MAYKKLTYSGTDCNNYLYFAFAADFFDTDKVTREMGIGPTSVMIKKNPVPKSTSWNYRISAGSDIDLETHLARLLDIHFPQSVQKMEFLADVSRRGLCALHS